MKMRQRVISLEDLVAIDESRYVSYGVQPDLYVTFDAGMVHQPMEVVAVERTPDGEVKLMVEVLMLDDTLQRHVFDSRSLRISRQLTPEDIEHFEKCIAERIKETG